ncbi:PfkB family carbohydrate kinase [Methylomonas sp. AM2-LC]|uniref:carbohydrate kinase family protein n=1 Tax=Methylomonas sp. AM2-LC TaxID=3153301 RepID=UPI0032630B09
MYKPNNFDVLCVGHASYDLVFTVPQHPLSDEKIVAEGLLGCGGGPAANAAVIVSKLGFKAGFCGYLGNELYGESHWQELQAQHVDTRYVVRGDFATPLSVVLVKPDGQRALINYKCQIQALKSKSIDFANLQTKVLLFDGHEPQISLDLLDYLAGQGVSSVLDAGSVHTGTLLLADKVDYLVCSEKFALQYAESVESALTQLSAQSAVVVITLGERGLIWRRGQEVGALAAPPLSNIIDTTGAGDAFHGAFAAAVAAGMSWLEILRFASGAGGLCCTKLGARTGLPDRQQLNALLAAWSVN